MGRIFFSKGRTMASSKNYGHELTDVRAMANALHGTDYKNVSQLLASGILKDEVLSSLAASTIGIVHVSAMDNNNQNNEDIQEENVSNIDTINPNEKNITIEKNNDQNNRPPTVKEKVNSLKIDQAVHNIAKTGANWSIGRAITIDEAREARAKGVEQNIDSKIYEHFKKFVWLSNDVQSQELDHDTSLKKFLPSILNNYKLIEKIIENCEHIQVEKVEEIDIKTNKILGFKTEERWLTKAEAQRPSYTYFDEIISNNFDDYIKNCKEQQVEDKTLSMFCDYIKNCKDEVDKTNENIDIELTLIKNKILNIERDDFPF